MMQIMHRTDMLSSHVTILTLIITQSHYYPLCCYLQSITVFPEETLVTSSDTGMYIAISPEINCSCGWDA